MSTLSTSKILICIYTCEKDVEHLNKLKETKWYKKYSKYKNITMVDVYAGQLEDEYEYKNGELVVNTEEIYTNLCEKTYKMLSACIDLFDFDYLIKLDSSLISYAHGKLDFRFTFEYFEKRFNEGFLTSKDYSGCIPIIGQNVKTLKDWSLTKNLNTCPSLFLAMCSVNILPDYWSGKTYSLSRDSCTKVLKNKYVFDAAKDYMAGTEDLSVALSLFINSPYLFSTTELTFQKISNFDPVNL